MVDDGSTDGTLPCGDIYKKIPHRGISAARNEAFRLSTGEYIFIIDSDDMVEPDAIAKLLERLEMGNDRVFSDYLAVDKDNNPIRELKWTPQTWKELLECNLMPHGSSLFRRSILEGIHYDESLESAVDYDLNMQLAIRYPNMKIDKVEEKLMRYRIHGDQEGSRRRQIDSALAIKMKYNELIFGPTQ